MCNLFSFYAVYYTSLTKSLARIAGNYTIHGKFTSMGFAVANV